MGGGKRFSIDPHEGETRMSRHPAVWVLLGTALGAVGGPAAAQRVEHPEPLPTIVQEVFLAELVYPQERGAVQLTGSSRLQHGAHTRLLGEYGITDRLQASVVTPIPESDPEEGERSWELGALYAVVPTGPVEVSASGEVEVEHGAPPVWKPSVIAAVGHGHVQLHGTARMEFSQGQHALGGGATALLDAGRLSPTAELVGGEGEETFVVPGLFVHPREGIEAGVGAPLCISCPSLGRQVRVVVTVEF
jgi:hypothetical protein